MLATSVISIPSNPLSPLGFNGIMVRINNEHVELNVTVTGRGIETTDSGLANPHRQLNS